MIGSEMEDGLRARYLRTYRDVCGWHEKIGFDEMTDHRLLTSDRLVQETRFSSGWNVVVNFGSAAWDDPRGFVVPGSSYHLFLGDHRRVRTSVCNKQGLMQEDDNSFTSPVHAPGWSQQVSILDTCTQARKSSLTTLSIALSLFGAPNAHAEWIYHSSTKSLAEWPMALG